MPIFNGYRDEIDDSKHWVYEDRLRPFMVEGSVGDVDLRPFSSPRHDQRGTSSCVGNAVAKALEIKRIMRYGHDAHVDLSRLAIYYLARELMFPSETQFDNGTYISHAFEVLRRFGTSTEELWPWDIARITTPPSFMAMRVAYHHKIKAYYRIRSQGQDRVAEVIRCLRSGNPVVFGCYVDATWANAGKNHLLKPVPANKALGRHATVLVGYVNGKFIGENSWGERWGDRGFYYMDPSVIADSGTRDLFVVQAGWEPYKGNV